MASQSRSNPRKRVLVAGLGDTGLLAAMELASDFEVVGISPKDCLVSGQELGTRLSQPERWKENYLMDFRRFEKLDAVERVQAQVTGIDPESGELHLRDRHENRQVLGYDALIIASGVTNGFWREPSFQTRQEVEASMAKVNQQIAQAQRLAIIGAGPSGTSSAANLALSWPQKQISLYFSGDKILPGYHEKVRVRVERQLRDRGVQLYAGHRAKIPQDLESLPLSTEAIEWSTGQTPSSADLVLWTVGQVKPNSAFVPASMLNAEGFVKVDEHLRVPGFSKIFAVGDIAASDPLRSSARNWGFRVVAHNVRMFLRGQEGKMKPYKSTPHRWGSVLGVQPDGLEVYQANGRHFRFPAWSIERVLYPFFLRRMIYRGVRPTK